VPVEGVDADLEVKLRRRSDDGDNVVEGPWADETAVRL